MKMCVFVTKQYNKSQFISLLSDNSFIHSSLLTFLSFGPILAGGGNQVRRHHITCDVCSITSLIVSEI